MLGQREQLLFAKEIMEILPNRLIYILMVNTVTTDIHMPKHLVIGQANNTFSSIVDPGPVSTIVNG